MVQHSAIDHTGVTGVGGSVATDTIFDAKGDLAVGTGANTSAKLTVGANDTIPMADSGQATGIKWVASQTPSTQAFSDAAAEGTADTYARGDHKHAMPANPGGGGATYGATLAYPTSFAGDNDDGSSFTPWVDQTAFDVATVENSTILHVITKGASKDQFKRKTLGTTKAAAFDFRWWGVTPDLTYWSSAEDAYAELRLLTSGGTQVAGWRIKPQTLAAGQVQYRVGVYGGGGIVTSNVDTTIIRGQAVVLRVVRDGSDKLRYYMGMGIHGGLTTWLQQSDDAPYNPTQSGTIARAEVAIHTPSGPGSTAEFGISWDAFESV